MEGRGGGRQPGAGTGHECISRQVLRDVHVWPTESALSCHIEEKRPRDGCPRNRCPRNGIRVWACWMHVHKGRGEA